MLGAFACAGRVGVTGTGRERSRWAGAVLSLRAAQSRLSQARSLSCSCPAPRKPRALRALRDPTRSHGILGSLRASERWDEKHGAPRGQWPLSRLLPWGLANTTCQSLTACHTLGSGCQSAACGASSPGLAWAAGPGAAQTLGLGLGGRRE